MRYFISHVALTAISALFAAYGAAQASADEGQIQTPKKAYSNALTSYDSILALRSARLPDSSFAAALQREYLAFAESESQLMRDYVDADYFARKGGEVAQVPDIAPENPRAWQVGSEPMNELLDGRERLLAAFQRGARDISPDLSAVAQVRYDCWVEQEEEGYQPDHIAACKQEFLESMDRLEAQLSEHERPKPDKAPPPAVAPLEPEIRSFAVYFDFDRSAIRSDALYTIRQAASQIRKSDSPLRILVTGHTDKAGSDTYNVNLSHERALAVRQALEAQGIPSSDISVEWRGELDPAIATPDGVPKQENRRATLNIELMSAP